MKLTFLSLFPEMYQGVFSSSIWKQAEEKGQVTYSVTDFRQFADNKHNKVDDYPFGGGAGMVLRAQPIYDAIESLQLSKDARVVLLCPQGEPHTQEKAEQLATADELVFICGHYEGYDERIRALATDEISIGDYVLTGGELASMVIADSVIRLQSGVLGNEQSAKEDSFQTGLLEHPHYTRPAEFRGMKVPDVLLSGHHRNIEEWRKKESFRRTYERRPDLLEDYDQSDQEEKWLNEFKNND
ncbi:tRNA (guanosine(37)-N1)-methyltransferase TrmD [Geomicrobium sp. JCM 19055]|uniref:tRNA (guanosine(37)-N1)-methyltransferase TrmD n=1 Tax=Geomicrobium sp. JCM 19055 TaxID=1460649 RepID=UPI00045ED864|nr:tRNA (guanosine(37)-N1)-methyltransferase TrmD [Geomicrobium sp. JCM 19055]GAK00292.1 tRNA (guanine37-N1) -methyltransferase [Geomicrobium sp. JCM 19055]